MKNIRVIKNSKFYFDYKKYLNLNFLLFIEIEKNIKY
jgi:hypothetical protein